jgi:putative flippase GtrA
VELTILHNFLWHERFTWPDRRAGGSSRVLTRLLRFHAANGVVSLCGNTVLLYILVDRLKLPMLPSALGGIALCGLVNFRVADTWIYASRKTPGTRSVDIGRSL